MEKTMTELKCRTTTPASLKCLFIALIVGVLLNAPHDVLLSLSGPVATITVAWLVCMGVRESTLRQHSFFLDRGQKEDMFPKYIYG